MTIKKNSITWQSLLQYHWLPHPAHTNWAGFCIQPWHCGALDGELAFIESCPSSITNLSDASSSSTWAG